MFILHFNVISIVDTTPPVLSRCPDDFEYISGRHVRWTEPIAYDVSVNVTKLQSHWPGMFLVESTFVVYSFTDPSANVAYCNFTITVVCMYLSNILQRIFYFILPYIFVFHSQLTHTLTNETVQLDVIV